jgi:hypothetical protein
VAALGLSETDTRRLLLAAAVAAAAVAPLGCRAIDAAGGPKAAGAAEPPRRQRVAAPLPPAPPGAAPTGAAPAGPASLPPPEPVVLVSDPALLGQLHAQGLDLGTVLTGERAVTAAALATHAPYRTLAAAVAADLAADRRSDPSAGVGMRHAHRQFDPRWLASGRTRFELVGVVNRLDRRPFAPAHCGEARLVYRLAYRVDTATGPVDSRLPMTVNAVFFMEPDAHGGCAEVARAWLRPPGVRERGEEGAWLVSDAGPLSPARRAAWKPKSVELNFQSVRWPSTVRPSMGGHAEYVLRVFHRVERAPYFVPSPLENTLDVPRLARERPLRDALAKWLGEPGVLVALDQGTPVVPEAFLAVRAVSVAPHGLARLANRPYSSVLDGRAFAALDLSAYETLRTPEAVLRRLDALSCPGCHQSRSIAGFHLLGVEPAEDLLDAIEVPMSPHLHAELERRRPYVVAVAEGRTPDERRPPPERGAHDDGLGAHCGLGAAFAAWTCAPGLRCSPTSEGDVGECVADGPPGIGDACEASAVSPAIDPRRDTARLAAPARCGEGRVCEGTSVGFPGGLCSGGCGVLPPGAVCGGIPLLAEFNSCLGAGKSFDRCVADNARPGALRACGFHTPCRDDYVCARTGSGGGCMPPYFLFQLRVDGHPI